jgi:hypothetical protein
MAYSLWGHNVRLGFEDQLFEDAINLQDARRDGANFTNQASGWIDTYIYTEWGKYAEQLKRYYTIFPSENIKVYIYEEFFKSGLPQYADVLNHLEVSNKQIVNEKVYNPAGSVRSKWLRNVLMERRWWKEPLKILLPDRIKQSIITKIKNLNRTKQSLPPLSDKTRKYLESLLYDDVRELETLLQRDLSDIWF